MGNNPVKNKVDNTKTGNLGEKITASYLQKQGFTIVEQQYKRKWGEIDIIAQKGALIHFIEVKSVTHETKADLEYAVSFPVQGLSVQDRHETWQPEDLVHKHKQRQLKRIIETWIAQERYTGNIQVDVVVVRIVPRETYASVKMIENVVFE